MDKLQEYHKRGLQVTRVLEKAATSYKSDREGATSCKSVNEGGYKLRE